jgi:diphthamide synthase subunit DPH2
MSQEDRKLMQLMDEHILNASPEELTKLQQADINTQLDGIWFYDICDISDQKQKKRDITTNKLFSK